VIDSTIIERALVADIAAVAIAAGLQLRRHGRELGGAAVSNRRPADAIERDLLRERPTAPEPGVLCDAYPRVTLDDEIAAVSAAINRIDRELALPPPKRTRRQAA
jgi:hypothetical protein